MIEQLALNPGDENFLAETDWFTEPSDSDLQEVYAKFSEKFDEFLRQFTAVLGSPRFSERTDPELKDSVYPEAVRLAGWPHQSGYAVLAMVHHDKETPVFISFGHREQV